MKIPWPVSRGEIIYPVFTPFSGCATRCVFCSQEKQTGVSRETPVKALLAACEKDLKFRAAVGKTPPILAFYGGTFTRAPRRVFEKCLDFAKRAREDGLITAFRCSTRPDGVSCETLEKLLVAGCDAVELGAQSFDDRALAKARRGYDGQTVLRATALIKSYGLMAGIQLMPGMPGVSENIFMRDVKTAIESGAASLRFYPCLVLAGTELEKRFRAGLYQPWSLARTIEVLSDAWLLTAKANIPVIRMGLAPQPELRSQILAGPRHACLGSRIMALAALKAVKRALTEDSGDGPWRLYVPDSCKGYILGWRGELRDEWEKIGVAWRSIEYTGENRLRLERVDSCLNQTASEGGIGGGLKEEVSAECSKNPAPRRQGGVARPTRGGI